jgi:hypothetical protein
MKKNLLQVIKKGKRGKEKGKRKKEKGERKKEKGDVEIGRQGTK